MKTRSYNIANDLVTILESISTNKFSIKNSFEFVKDVIEHDSGLFMASNVDSSLVTYLWRRL